MCAAGDAAVLATLSGGAAVVPRAEGGAGSHRALRAGRLTAPAAAAAAARAARLLTDACLTQEAGMHSRFFNAAIFYCTRIYDTTLSVES